MNCKKVQLLMCLYIADDPALTVKERLAFANHLQNCQECAREYEESKFVIDLAREHWQVSKDTLALIEKANKYVKPRMAVKEGWKDLKRRIPGLAQLENRRKRFRLFHRVGAVAACLSIGVSIFLAFSYYSKPEIAQELIPEQVAFAPKPSVKVELVSDNSKLLVPLGHKIVTAKEMKILIINDKHRMVINVNTTLTVDPLVDGSRLGCLVKLASGEILAHVEHDGNPFVVSTAHGKAVITGTIFDIKTTDFSTTLVVAEGTVQFESEKGFVKITAGQISMIVAQSAPTKPISCDTAELTAWITDHELTTTLARIESFSDDYDTTALWLSAMSGPINLENINYEEWIEEKRNWFRGEFPWIFQLQSALAQESVKVEYPELLVKSGDIWQFIYPQNTPGRIPIFNTDLLLKAASKYGFNKQWLLENVLAAKFVIGAPEATKDRFTGLKAFEKWASYFEQLRQLPDALDSDTLLYSIHASRYLANTRTLVWLSINNGKAPLRSVDKAALSALLLTESYTANNLTGKIIKLLWTSQSESCGECQGLVDEIIEDIDKITSIEKRILEYENRK
ncbi:MAG: hypothetical protein FVQ84_04335 [Planctomycetes bacterium]|nr:hypothetical protein [Planctomycetota bacterium]